LSWVKEFYVENPDLYASTIDRSLWMEGERVARSIARLCKEKKLGRDLKILDVPCGMGRVAIPLAKMGFSVVGLDISPRYLEVARKKSQVAGVSTKTTFLLGKAEELSRIVQRRGYDGKFDAAMSIHTNLGYGSQFQDEAFLRGIRRAVKKGGLFILTARRNKANISRDLSESQFQETDRMVIMFNHRFAKSKSRLFTMWRFYRKIGARGGNAGRVKDNDLQFLGKFHTSVRLYSTMELEGLLEKTGWRILESSDSIHHRYGKITESSSGIYFLSTSD
jgi:ubiquinone/menaquinone biosynthesis C-methylase UbiE